MNNIKNFDQYLKEKYFPSSFFNKFFAIDFFIIYSFAAYIAPPTKTAATMIFFRV